MKAAVTRFLSSSMLTLAAAFGPAAYAQVPMADGEVRKVDKDNQKITLKHGEIKHLDMPGMTMVFNVKEASLLDKVKTGDKVQFRAVSESGKFTVTEIQVAK